MKRLIDARELTLLNFTSFLFQTTYFLLIPVLPIYLYRDLRASEQEVGAILSMAALTSALTRIPCSIRINRRNVLKVLALGLWLNVISIIGYGVSWNPYVFAFFRILYGVGLAINYTLLLTIASMIAESSEIEKSIISYTAAIALGFLIGPLLGVVLRELIELRYLILATAGLGIVTVLPIISLRKRLKMEKHESAEPLMEYRGFISFKSMAVHPIMIYFYYSFSAGAIWTYGPLKAKLEFGLADQFIILFFIIFYFTAFSGRIFLLKLKPSSSEDRKVIWFLMGSLISAASGLLLIGLSRNLTLFGFGLFLAGIAHGLVFPLTASLVAFTLPHDIRVLGNAFLLTAFDIGSFISPFLISLMIGIMPLSHAFAMILLFPLMGLFNIKKLLRMYSRN